MRVACVLLPHFPLLVALQPRAATAERGAAALARQDKHAADTWDRPFILAGPPPGRRAGADPHLGRGLGVHDCSPHARRAGVRPGMSLGEALARCPQAVVLEVPSPERLARQSARLLEAAARVSPLVEDAEPGCAFVGLDGLAGAGDPARELRLAAALQQEVRAALGATPRVGVADSRVAARAAARLAPAAGAPPANLPAAPGAVRRRDGPVPPTGPTRWAAAGPRRAVVAPGAAATAAFLAPLPVRWLSLSAALQERLAWLGIHTVGELAALPKPALLAQAGSEGGRAWALAHGGDDGPIPPYRPPTQLRAALAFPRPVTERAAIHAGLRHLLARLTASLAESGRTARGATLVAALAGDQEQRWTVTVREPTAAAAPLARVLTAKLAASPLPAAVTALALTLHGLGGEVGMQGSLGSIRARAPRRAALAMALAALRARFGRPMVMQIVRVEPWSRIPERRYALVPADGA